MKEEGEKPLDRVTITISGEAKRQLEDIARQNKRNKRPDATVSEIVRSALRQYLK